MISFDPAHRAVHYPPDRRFRLWIRPSILIGTGIAILSVIAASWIEVAVAGLPPVAAVPQIYPNNFAGPHGFPVWVRYCHFFNSVSYTHLRAHETGRNLVCRLLLEKK